MHTPTNADEFQPSASTVETVTRQAIARYEGTRGNLLPILHAIQHALGCIPAGAVPVLAQALQQSRAEIHGVIRFYPHFRQTPAAPVTLEICRAESCQAMGANALADHARRQLACGFNESSPDGKVTLQPVYCLGLCAQSPAVMINGQPHARVTPQKLDRLLQAQGCRS